MDHQQTHHWTNGKTLQKDGAISFGYADYRLGIPFAEDIGYLCSSEGVRRLRKITWILALLLAALAVWHACQFRFVSIDDAYITYRYADNIAAGNGYVFNRGERVEGTSTFLFTLLLAFGRFLGFDIDLLARVLGMAAFAAVILVTFNYVQKSIAGYSGVLLASSAGLMLASSTALAFHAAVGMELVPYILFLSLGVFGFVRSSLNSANCKHWMLWLALAGATRTESFVLAGALLGVLAISGCWLRLSGRCNAKLPWSKCPLLRSTFELLAIVLPLFAFRRAYFGAWVPNSVTAKSGFLSELLSLPVSDMLERVWHAQGCPCFESSRTNGLDIWHG